MRHQPHNSKGNYNYNVFFYEDRAYAPHFHKNYELIYCVKGRADEVFVGDTRVPLSEGELLLISPWQIHSFSVPVGVRVWVAVFSKEYISDFAKHREAEQYGAFRPDPDSAAYLEKTLFFAVWPPLFTAKSALYAVCAQCAAHAPLLGERKHPGFAERVLTYLSAHYREELSMHDAAGALGYEYHYFSRLYHDAFGMDFRQMVSIFRFEKALECLARDELDLGAVAAAAGFQSARTFNRVFKSMSGQTPKEYRQGLKN